MKILGNLSPKIPHSLVEYIGDAERVAEPSIDLTADVPQGCKGAERHELGATGACHKRLSNAVLNHIAAV